MPRLVENMKFKLGGAFNRGITQQQQRQQPQDMHTKLLQSTLLFVGIPLDLMLVCTTDSGKELLMDLLIAVLPDQVPIDVMEMAIEDGFLTMTLMVIGFTAILSPLLIHILQRLASSISYHWNHRRRGPSRRNNQQRQFHFL